MLALTGSKPQHGIGYKIWAATHDKRQVNFSLVIELQASIEVHRKDCLSEINLIAWLAASWRLFHHNNLSVCTKNPFMSSVFLNDLFSFKFIQKHSRRKYYINIITYFDCLCCWMYRVNIACDLEDWSFIFVEAVVLK